MADFKDERAYDSKTLVKVFLWSSLALLLCVVWMAWDDYHKPWKEYQREFMRMEFKRALEERRDAKGEIDPERYNQLRVQLRDASRELKKRKGAIRKLEAKGVKLKAEIYALNQNHQMVKARIDEKKYLYSEHYLRRGKDDEDMRKDLEDLTARSEKMGAELFELKEAKKAAEKELAGIYAERDGIADQLKALRAEFDRHTQKARNVRFDWVFKIRNAMLLDFMSPTIKIKQVVMTNLPEDMYFTKTMRVDRCTTCHLAIDKKGWEDAPQPFRTHPRLDLYVGATSPHTLDKTGCTVCHGGVGQALDFNMCAHMPNDEETEKRWKEKFDWHEPHYIDNPMVRLKHTEGSCLKCHGSQQYVNHAPKLNRGRELMVTRGCVGCHKVKHLEETTPAGPGLLKVKGKLKREFVEKWVWNPVSFNKNARMPAFFDQSNNQDPEGMAKNRAELKALVDLIFEKSANYTPAERAPSGSASRGGKLFKEVGCMACHGVDDVGSFRSDFAPDLSAAGSKLSADWIYTWVRNPRHYDPNTRMPSLRLSSQEAADITAYLMSKRNKDFEALEAPVSDDSVRDGLILSYLVPQLGVKGSEEKLASMSSLERDRFLGQKTMNKYACFACHTIQGYEDASRIGTELSEWGSKRVNQIDFGYTDVHHTHEDFLRQKLKDPRYFDRDKVVPFNDRLKMPNFHLSDEDREALIVAVLGLTKSYIPEGMTAGYEGKYQLMEKGRRVVADFNCRGCHLVEQQGGRIRELYKAEGRDVSLAPPDLWKEGSKVQVDWFRDFLTDVKPIRPWLTIRMPSFHWTDEELSDVITYFNLRDDQVYPFEKPATRRLTGDELARARELFTKLQCEKCHIVGSKMPADLSTAAPDLLKVHRRLKPDWVVEWLENPDSLMPGTRMPGFWAEGAVPDAESFGGDSLKQREALRDYLYMLGR